MCPGAGGGGRRGAAPRGGGVARLLGDPGHQRHLRELLRGLYRGQHAGVPRGGPMICDIHVIVSLYCDIRGIFCNHVTHPGRL